MQSLSIFFTIDDQSRTLGRQSATQDFKSLAVVFMVMLGPFTFDVPLGQAMLITGPFGVVKSSPLRGFGWALDSLWRACCNGIVPQRPNVSLGILREHVCYPMTSAEIEKVISDAVIVEILRKVPSAVSSTSVVFWGICHALGRKHLYSQL